MKVDNKIDKILDVIGLEKLFKYILEKKLRDFWPKMFGKEIFLAASNCDVSKFIKKEGSLIRQRTGESDKFQLKFHVEKDIYFTTSYSHGKGFSDLGIEDQNGTGLEIFNYVNYLPKIIKNLEKIVESLPDDSAFSLENIDKFKNALQKWENVLVMCDNENSSVLPREWVMLALEKMRVIAEGRDSIDKTVFSERSDDCNQEAKEAGFFPLSVRHTSDHSVHPSDCEVRSWDFNNTLKKETRDIFKGKVHLLNILKVKSHEFTSDVAELVFKTEGIVKHDYFRGFVAGSNTSSVYFQDCLDIVRLALKKIDATIAVNSPEFSFFVRPDDAEGESKRAELRYLDIATFIGMNSAIQDEEVNKFIKKTFKDKNCTSLNIRGSFSIKSILCSWRYDDATHYKDSVKSRMTIELSPKDSGLDPAVCFVNKSYKWNSGEVGVASRSYDSLVPLAGVLFALKDEGMSIDEFMNTLKNNLSDGIVTEITRKVTGDKKTVFGTLTVQEYNKTASVIYAELESFLNDANVIAYVLNNLNKNDDDTEILNIDLEKEFKDITAEVMAGMEITVKAENDYQRINDEYRQVPILKFKISRKEDKAANYFPQKVTFASLMKIKSDAQNAMKAIGEERLVRVLKENLTRLAREIDSCGISGKVVFLKENYPADVMDFFLNQSM